MSAEAIAYLKARLRVDGSGCWLWTGVVDSNGYGNVRMEQHRNRGAHRVAYEVFVGPIGEGLQLDHLCRVRTCINPAHLEPVTPRENTLRGNAPAARQARQTHCKRGHEFTPENTRVWRNTRRCLTCARLLRKAGA